MVLDEESEGLFRIVKCVLGGNGNSSNQSGGVVGSVIINMPLQTAVG